MQTTGLDLRTDRSCTKFRVAESAVWSSSVELCHLRMLGRSRLTHRREFPGMVHLFDVMPSLITSAV